MTIEDGALFVFGDAARSRKIETIGERVVKFSMNITGDLMALLTVDGELDPPFYGSSANSGEGGADLEEEVLVVAVPVGHSFDHLDL
ncbi:MAG: hypothetical protein JSU86_06355, partial [Phycisphaerales bacterium]